MFFENLNQMVNDVRRISFLGEALLTIFFYVFGLRFG